MIECILIGGGGRMGRFVRELAADERHGFAVVQSIERDDDLLAACKDSRATVGIDFTRAGLGFEHGLVLLEHGLRPLIGTSGVSLEENEMLDARARELHLGGLVVPNFSLGMWCLQEAAQGIAVHMDAVEIIERHHPRKLDAPSGTALDTAERIAAVRGRDPAELSIHSVRLPGHYAHQEVLFGGPGESLSLRHDMSGPAAFGPGIALCVRHVQTARGVGRGLGVALAEKGAS